MRPGIQQHRISCIHQGQWLHAPPLQQRWRPPGGPLLAQQQKCRPADRMVVCTDSMAAAGSPAPDNIGGGPSSGSRPSLTPGSAAGAKGGPDMMGELTQMRCAEHVHLLLLWPLHGPTHCFGGILIAAGLCCCRPAFLVPATVDLLEQVSGSTALSYLDRFKAPKWLFRTVACLVLGGQVMARIFKGARTGAQYGKAARAALWGGTNDLSCSSASPLDVMLQRQAGPTLRGSAADDDDARNADPCLTHSQAKFTCATPVTSWCWLGPSRWAWRS
jgi:hypothetical protein